MKRLTFFLIVCLNSSGVLAQDLTKHLWKESVFLIFSKDKESKKLQEQLRLLSNEKKRLLERKIKI